MAISAKFSHNFHLILPLMGFPLQFCNSSGVTKKLVMSLPDGGKFDDICIRLDTTPESDGLTDGWIC